MFCRVASQERLIPSWVRWCIAVIVATAAAGCLRASDLVLTQQLEARRLAADLRVQFTKAADASNRAVMADTDEASVAAAREAKQATEAAQQDTQALQSILQKLAYTDEIQFLDAFNKHFAEYRTLDDTVLGLAVENTNLKAQQLSFGPASEAATAFKDALESIAHSVLSKEVDALVARAILSVREIQVLEARHIAESDDAAMTRMEAQMANSEAAARLALKTLAAKVPRALEPNVREASAALDRFHAVNAEIVALSRRNSNVRSLALALGRKRTLTAEGDDALQGLEEALARHEFKATR